MSVMEHLTEGAWFKLGINNPARNPNVPAVCLAVAVRDAEGVNRLNWNLERMAEIIRRLWPERVTDDAPINIVTMFNDHPETTFAEVWKVAREFDLEADFRSDSDGPQC